ncbi:MAG: hypothetical protein AB7O52_18510 [Planctomycetota bacterium]
MTKVPAIIHNPLVVRAFRVGFRSGPQSIRLGIWLLVLVAIVLGSLALRYFVPEVDNAVLGEILALATIFYSAAAFLLGGLQRMLKSFSYERERGTYEFLHLSTLRPSALVGGFLWAGQLPGYLLLGASLPVLAVGVGFAGLSYWAIGMLLGLLVFYVLFVSLAFLNLGFWLKKAADIRGSLFVGIGIVGSVASAFSSTGGVWRPLGILAGYPVLSSAWKRAQPAAAGASSWSAGFDLRFFEWTLPIEGLAVAFLAPIGWLLFVSLLRCVRDRGRKPISDRGVLFLVTWVLLFLVGFLWGAGLNSGSALLVMTAVTLALTQLTAVTSMRTARALRQRLTRAGRVGREVLLGQDAPPYLLALAIAVCFTLFAGAWIAVATQELPGGSAPSRLPCPPWPAALVLLAPLGLIVFLRQYLEFLGSPILKRVSAIVTAALLWWGPFVAHLMLHANGSVPRGETQDAALTALYWLTLASPLSQIHAWSGFAGPIAGLDEVVIGLFQALYLALFVTLILGARVQVRRLAREAREVPRPSSA